MIYKSAEYGEHFSCWAEYHFLVFGIYGELKVNKNPWCLIFVLRCERYNTDDETLLVKFLYVLHKKRKKKNVTNIVAFSPP